MPTYAYACSSCEHAFDVQQSFSDDALTVCPRCEQESLRKVFSAVGVVFKGSGFYRTDSRANATSRSRGAGSSAPTSTGSTSGGSSSGAESSPRNGAGGTTAPSPSSSGASSPPAATG